jgi:hypothetical protein
MAVNQVSLFFYPPRWRQRLREIPGTRAVGGAPVRVADAVREPEADGPAVSFEAVVRWLADQGFAPVEWGKGSCFHRGQIRSIFGLEQEIDVDVGEEAGEATDLYCRFTLPKGELPPLHEWARFVAALCERFWLRLGDDGVTPCTEAEFEAAVRRHRNWREFAAAFGWSLF